MDRSEIRDKDSFFSGKQSLNCRGRLLMLDKPLVMGILNVTPDSFYDGGKHSSTDHFIKHVQKMLNEGADIIDIGAVSTRPGAGLVSAAEEQERLFPVLEKLREAFPDIVISIDTFRACSAREAVRNGDDIINDS
ncbi:MAG: dihydropteroate synthase, partial [Bacteroidota bacterium]